MTPTRFPLHTFYFSNKIHYDCTLLCDVGSDRDRHHKPLCSSHCVFVLQDQTLPRLIRGQVHRCVGNYDRQKDTMTCVSVRAASLSEQRNALEAVKVSDARIRDVVLALSEM